MKAAFSLAFWPDSLRSVFKGDFQDFNHSKCAICHLSGVKTMSFSEG